MIERRILSFTELAQRHRNLEKRHAHFSHRIALGISAVTLEICQDASEGRIEMLRYVSVAFTL